MNKKKALKLRRLANVMAMGMKAPDAEVVYRNLKKMYPKTPKNKR